jgi:hypothetical protein
MSRVINVSIMFIALSLPGCGLFALAEFGAQFVMTVLLPDFGATDWVDIGIDLLQGGNPGAEANLNAKSPAPSQGRTQATGEGRYGFVHNTPTHTTPAGTTTGGPAEGCYGKVFVE